MEKIISILDKAIIAVSIILAIGFAVYIMGGTKISLDEPYCEVYDMVGCLGNQTFVTTGLAYEEQAKAVENPTIIYADVPNFGRHMDTDNYVVIKLYSQDGTSVKNYCYTYGSFLIYNVTSQHSAYAYVILKPLSEKPVETSNNAQQANAS